MSLRALNIGLLTVCKDDLMYLVPSDSEVFSISSAMLFNISQDESSVNSSYISVFYLL